jgi:flagellar biosynthesis/type III secretory pathway protein FliH
VAERAKPLFAPGPSPAQSRRIARDEVQARFAAERILREARAEAEAIVLRAREEARGLAVDARQQADAEADARLTARWVALRDEEARRIESEAGRVVPIAVALAERLVGAALELEPGRIAPLVASVLAEARSVRRATIRANPADAEALSRHFTALGLDPAFVDLRPDASLARGSLLLHTDLGVIDARLPLRLERLAEVLRDALR